jgi:hypothetical protein
MSTINPSPVSAHASDPDALANRCVLHEPRPQCDEQRCEVLDEQRNANRKAVDGEEVEELHEREAAHAERDEVRQLASREAQAMRCSDCEDRDQPHGCAERSHLREPLRREARREDRLRHAAVQSPKRGGGRGHQVAEPRAPVAGRLDGERRLAHLHSFRGNGT